MSNQMCFARSVREPLGARFSIVEIKHHLNLPTDGALGDLQ